MEQTIVIPDENVEIYDVVEEINHEHELCIGSMRNGIEHAIRVGELLSKQRESVREGDWYVWIRANLNFTPDHARKYIKIFNNQARVLGDVNVTSMNKALRIIAAADPKPKPAELPEPEKENTYFSWFDDERVTDVYDAIKKINSIVTFLKSSKEDRGAIEQILKQWDTALNKIIENIRE
jgi:hypothetical protein